MKNNPVMLIRNFFPIEELRRFGFDIKIKFKFLNLFTYAKI